MNIAPRRIPPQHTPPHAPARASSAEYHGIGVLDDYAWLRADNWQHVMREPSALAPEIATYLKAENAYAEAMLGGTAELRQTLFEEMKGRIKQDDSSVPAPDGPYVYYSRYVTDGQQPLFCRRPRDGAGSSAPERVLLDGNALSENEAYFKIGGVAHSPDHGCMAYAVDDKGSEFFRIELVDAETGAARAEAIPDSNGGMAWAADGKTLYYVWVDQEHRPREIRKRALADAFETVLFVQDDPAFFLGLGETQSRRFLTISTHDHESAEIHLLDQENPGAGLRLVAPRRSEHDYSVEHHEDRLIILTNDGAEDYRIVAAPLETPGPEHWREIEPHRPGRLILDIVAFKHHLVRLEREDGLPRIVIRRFADGEEHAIAFPEEAYSLGIAPGYEYDTATLRFTYSSMTTPSQVFDYDMETRERICRKSQEIPSGHNPDHYVTRRVLAPAPDGEQVPVSILYHRDTKLDGSAPLLLYGYGAYGIAIPASFSVTALSLVDRGFVYAIAHIRGGKDKGYAWYRKGKREKKVNSFTDFIAAGEYLSDQRYTSRGHIVAQGGSAGGMLMGAVANMAPDLFLGIIAEVPFVDVLNTMLDADLPLTPPEWNEWGNPIEDAEAFRAIADYSPYDNVREHAYPHMLVVAGLTDPRVTYWEPAKWVAKLRAKKTDERMLLLRTNMEAGHGGASGRFDRLKEVALSYAFALEIAGKTHQQPVGR